MTTTKAARLDSRINRDCENGCWEWTGKRTQGYGRLEVAGRTIAAHRVVYEALVGPIPQGRCRICRDAYNAQYQTKLRGTL